MLTRVASSAFALTMVLALAAVAEAKTIVVTPGAPGETPIADAVAQLEDEDVLVIKKGTYGERLVLSNLENITIRGRGKPRLGDGGDLAQIQIVNCTSIALSGLVVVEGGDQGILLSASDGCSVTRCTIESPAEAGIRVLTSHDVTIQKCRIGGTATAAGGHEGIVSTESDRLLVTKCRLEAGLDDGVQVVQGEDVEILKNRFRGILDRGVFFQSLRLTCERNRFDDCQNGVRSSSAGDSTGTTISRNRMRKIGTSGGVRIFTPNVTVTRNLIQDVDGLGVGNTFLADGMVVSGNKIRDARLGGIVNNASNSEVTGNRVTKATDEGIAARGTLALYEDNVVKQTNGDGILVTQGGNTFRDNRVNGSTGTDLRSTRAKDQNTFEGNRFGTETYP